MNKIFQTLFVNHITTFWLRFLLLAMPLVGVVNLALAQESNNYQIDDSQAGPTTFQQSSGSFVIDGSIEPIVGDLTGGSFGAEIGSPRNPGSAASSTPSPGGGGGLVTIEGLTLNGFACTVVYNNLVNLNGNKTEEMIYVFVNGSLSGVSFPTPRTWQKVMWLTAPQTAIEIFARNEAGYSTNPINITLELRRMGDINGDGVTNDYDLSLLARKWNALNDCPTDLNRDGITDDYDLSLLASAWNG